MPLIGSGHRWAEVAREMLITGDVFHPTINGEPYVDKPLGGYWLILLTASITGSLNQWAVRLPSALGAAWMMATGLSTLCFADSWLVPWRPNAPVAKRVGLWELTYLNSFCWTMLLSPPRSLGFA